MDSTLDAIYNALSASVQTDGAIYYGIAVTHPYDAPWNYTVVGREPATVRANGITDRWSVAVVREDYIPEGTLESVLDAIEGLPGFRCAEDEAEFLYDVKPDTDRTMEMMVLHFEHPRKRGV